MRSAKIRRSLGPACVVVGVLGLGVQAFGQAPDGKVTPSTRGAARVRVIERGTRKPVAGAVVDRYVSEVRFCDSWRYRIVGDDLLPRQEDEAKRRPAPNVPGTAWTSIAEGTEGRAISDAAGVAHFDRAFDGGATLVASTPSLRGARVVDVEENAEVPAEVEIEVGPPRAVDVVVAGADGTPRAGIPVEFGRFFDGALQRECGDGAGDDRCELWDRLGARVFTDEKGRAKLVGLELHGVDDLDVLQGAKASPFCARAMLIGATRVVAAVDPDAPPSGPVTLNMPAVGSVELNVELPDHRRIEVDGDFEVFAAKSPLAPGFGRLVDVARGRARLFPVEAGVAATIGMRSKVCDDGTLTATAVQLGYFSDPVFGSTLLPAIESSCTLPRSEGERVEAALPLPRTWFQVHMRLLDAASRPLMSVDVDATLVAAVPSLVGVRERKCPGTKSTADGHVAFLMRRPVVPAALTIELTAKTPKGFAGGRAERSLTLGDDAWSLDLGDVVLDR